MTKLLYSSKKKSAHGKTNHEEVLESGAKHGRINYKIYDVIRSFVATEKSTMVRDNNRTYLFNVSLGANKNDIREAIELIFSVKVESVNTLVAKGKKRVFRGIIGKKSDFKRAYVKLAPDQMIDVEKGIS